MTKTKPQAQGPDLTPTLLEMQAQLARLQAELDSLKGRTYTRTHSQPQPATEPKPKVSSSRRKLLRQLAGGLVAGLAVAGLGATTPEGAEAKLSSNPTGNGLTGRVGMLVMPPGATVSGTLGGVSGTKVGILVSGDTSFNLTNNQLVPTVNSAIIGYTSGGGTAVVGLSQTGVAVYGQATANFGVWGASTSSHGVYGSTSSPSSAGVYGVYNGNDQYGSGVQGFSPNGNGVWGDSPGDGTGSGIGVFGRTSTGRALYGLATDYTGYAGLFDGKVSIFGVLWKSGGSFKIDHPLDPANKYLYHSFVESPDMMNIYNGIVTLDGQGEATVEMPDWFEALNFDFRYQLTCMDQHAPIFVAQRIKDRKFKIAGGLPGQEISWQVTGIRQDEWAKAHRIPVEEDKNDKEKGKYLNPELFGQPEEKSVSPRPPRKPGGEIG